MIIHTDFQQGDIEWGLCRAGIPTASDFDQLLTPKFEVRTGEMPKSYLARKLAEAWSGAPLVSFSMPQMEQGQLLEGEAVRWYEDTFGKDLDRPAFIQTDDRSVGCSPDALFKMEYGLEIKSPEPQTHVKYLLNGVLPPDYAAQVHGCMFVTGLPRWEFVSYRRHFPNLVLRIERDMEIQEKIAEALDEFTVAFERGMQRLEDAYGLPRPKWTPYIPPPKVEKPPKPDNRIDVGRVARELAEDLAGPDIVP